MSLTKPLDICLHNPVNLLIVEKMKLCQLFVLLIKLKIAIYFNQ